MSKKLTPQLKGLNDLNEQLNKIITYIEDAKKSNVMPSFFEFLDTGNIHSLAKQNQNLKKRISLYEQTLIKVGVSIEQVIEILKTFKD